MLYHLALFIRLGRSQNWTRRSNTRFTVPNRHEHKDAESPVFDTGILFIERRVVIAQGDRADVD